MKEPLKPRDKITQKMTRDGLVEVNETQQTAERISKRTQDADFQKSPEQQTTQDAAAQLNPVSDTIPLPHAPGAAPKADTGKTERVMEHIEAAHTRKRLKTRYAGRRQKLPQGRNLPGCNLLMKNFLPRSLKNISRNPTKPLTAWIRQRQLSLKKRNW